MFRAIPNCKSQSGFHAQILETRGEENSGVRDRWVGGGRDGGIHALPHCGGRIIISMDVHILALGICMLSLQMGLNDESLDQEIILNYPNMPNIITSGLKIGRGKNGTDEPICRSGIEMQT